LAFFLFFRSFLTSASISLSWSSEIFAILNHIQGLLRQGPLRLSE
jgi:hypothetical protein